MGDNQNVGQAHKDPSLKEKPRPALRASRPLPVLKKWVTTKTSVISFLLTAAVYLFTSPQGSHWFEGLELVFHLLVHEMGHYVAFKAFGIRPMGVIFIPYLGGAVIAKSGLSGWKKAVIYLAGPFAGFLGSVVLLARGIATKSLKTVSWAYRGFLMNFSQLFPIIITDGAQVASAIAEAPGWGEAIGIAVAYLVLFRVLYNFMDFAFVYANSLQATTVSDKTATSPRRTGPTATSPLPGHYRIRQDRYQAGTKRTEKEPKKRLPTRTDGDQTEKEPKKGLLTMPAPFFPFLFLLT